MKEIKLVAVELPNAVEWKKLERSGTLFLVGFSDADDDDWYWRVCTCGYSDIDSKVPAWEFGKGRFYGDTVSPNENQTIFKLPERA